MDSERDQRQQEWNTRAKINISEGEKQSSMLYKQERLYNNSIDFINNQTEGVDSMRILSDLMKTN